MFLEPARVLGTSQARISELTNGRVAQMTYDRLLGWLNALSRDVQITVVPPVKRKGISAAGY
ncbi:MAG: XRE family transcriptional regulator [Janthinobacterium lividum]